MKRADDSDRRTDERLSNLEGAAKVFDEWRPRIEASVDDVKLEVGKLARHWDRSVRDKAPRDTGLLPHPKLASERPPAPDAHADGPVGHRVERHHRDDGFGSVFVQTHVPIKGASFSSDNSSPHGTFHPFQSTGCPPPPPPLPNHRSQHFHDPPYSGRLPKLQFPEFEGENPKLWLSRCEDYFDMYNIPPDLRVRVVVSQIKGVAARWTQAVEARLKLVDWVGFTKLFMDRFGRDQQELLFRQFFRLKQLNSVAAYVEEFSGLVDQLVAYSHSTDPLYYTTRFIDGLCDDIRSIVLVHRPSSLDSACSLALLQDEVGDSSRRKDFRRPDASFMSRPQSRGPMPLPHPLLNMTSLLYKLLLKISRQLISFLHCGLTVVHVACVTNVQRSGGQATNAHPLSSFMFCRS